MLFASLMSLLHTVAFFYSPPHFSGWSHSDTTLVNDYISLIYSFFPLFSFSALSLSGHVCVQKRMCEYTGIAYFLKDIFICCFMYSSCLITLECELSKQYSIIYFCDGIYLDAVVCVIVIIIFL